MENDPLASLREAARRTSISLEHHSEFKVICFRWLGACTRTVQSMMDKMHGEKQTNAQQAEALTKFLLAQLTFAITTYMPICAESRKIIHEMLDEAFNIHERSQQ